MDDLIKRIEQLKNSHIKEVIDNRIKEFSKVGSESIDKIFKELCFCIMTANCDAQRCIDAHESIDVDGESRPLIAILHQLWDDESKMPTTMCGMLDMPVNSTYSQAVRKLANNR